MQSINQSPHVHCFYQPMKEGVREGIGPDYSIFDGSHPAFDKHQGKFFFAKEVLGHSHLEECCFELFPNQDAIKRSKPLFLLRDPIETWSSWKKCKAAGKQGWEGVCDLNLFKRAYQHTYDTFISVRNISEQVTCLTREHLLKNPRQLFQSICRLWDIPFTENMINWKQSFDVDSFTCGNDDHRETLKIKQYDHRETFSRIQHNDVRNSMSFYAVEENQNRWQHTLVTPQEREEIEVILKPLHKKFAIWGEEYYPLDVL